ncbi:transporter substrate-binding domain-containing protein [Georgenia yuyongxinii]|uniref:Transporter substrate-binding domain-containing protein n=1 Tax=Georgenia yuyongxinii TaxID=2589797 RepID=A0A552WTZ7_9MICO|nr:transporter substrate-binding domain-containing protein [Georgenia yuyongxinii]TRW45803.1 transporter substrate-binding domain-containing protein [Georgenia yuyongxinii]
MMLKRNLAMAGALAALLGLSACANPVVGDTPDNGETPEQNEQETAAVEAVPEIAEMLPAEIRERGTLQIGATSTNMPAQFTDENGDLVGVVIELYEAAAAVLDVEADFDVVTFDALQPGVESGRYDIATMGANKERMELFDIISLYQNGFATIAHAGSEDDELDYKTDLCGRSVAVTKGTLVERLVGGDISTACVEAGQPEIEVSSYVDNAGVALAVTSEQNDLGVLEIVVALAYADRDPDAVKVVDTDVTLSSGAAVKQGNDELRDAVQAAMLHLVDTGAYEEIMTKYGIADMMLPEMPIDMTM